MSPVLPTITVAAVPACPALTLAGPCAVMLLWHAGWSGPDATRCGLPACLLTCLPTYLPACRDVMGDLFVWGSVHMNDDEAESTTFNSQVIVVKESISLPLSISWFHYLQALYLCLRYQLCVCFFPLSLQLHVKADPAEPTAQPYVATSGACSPSHTSASFRPMLTSGSTGEQ